MITFLLGIILFIFESLLLYKISSVQAYFMGHLLTIFILSVYAYGFYRKKGDLLYPLLLLIFGCAAGPFGLGSFLVLFILHPLFSCFSTSSEIWLEGLFPKKDLSQFEQIIQRIKSQWDNYTHLSEASSFHNFFTFGSISDKQMILDVITEDFDPSFSPILKQALGDRHNVVRIQAAAIVTKIDIDFDSELKRLQKMHLKTPKDEKILMLLAEHADAYSSLGTLDDLRQQEISSLAIKYYQALPDTQKTWLALGRLYFREKNYTAFVDWYEESRKRMSSIPSILHSWYLESLYTLKHYDKFANEVKVV